MLKRVGVVAGLALLVTALQAQQPGQPQGQSQTPQTKGQEPPITVYRVDLVPTGTAFAMNEPVLEGDVWVFRSLPDRTLERVPKSKVKAVSRWSTDYSKEFVFQVEFVPTGGVLVREEPVKKGTNFVFKTWRQGTLLSMQEADVKKITRLTGFEAFKAEMTELGVVVLKGETTEAGFNNAAANSPEPAGASSQPPGARPGQGNWTYQGTPGSSDAYAPAGGTVAKPGDTPMAPQPTRPPR